MRPRRIAAGSGDSCKELKCIDSMCVLETKDNGTPCGQELPLEQCTAAFQCLEGFVKPSLRKTNLPAPSRM